MPVALPLNKRLLADTAEVVMVVKPVEEAALEENTASLPAVHPASLPPPGSKLQLGVAVVQAPAPLISQYCVAA